MRFEVYGTEGVLIYYGQGQPREGIWSAKAGDAELLQIATSKDVQQAWSRAIVPTSEAIFIAAVRGEEAPPVIPRFYDGMKLMEFAEAWRCSLERGVWCELADT
jgi:hypothetical protein